MKKCFFIALMFFYFSNCSFCQEPNAFLKIDCTNFSTDIKKIITNYAFSTLVFKNLDVNNSEIKKLDGERFWMKDEYFYISICCSIPKKGNIIMLKTLENQTKKCMYLYIRCSDNFDFGEYLELNKFNFFEGIYFFDLCKSKNKYEKVDFINFKKHSIGLKKLRRIINKYDCK
jgi:hypothetical protein